MPALGEVCFRQGSVRPETDVNQPSPALPGRADV